MKKYKGIEYPDLNEALSFYQVPSQAGGFNKDERMCVNLLIKLPKTGVMLSIDGVNKDELFADIHKYGHVNQQIKEKVEEKIDSVCRGYIDAVMSGDLAI